MCGGGVKGDEGEDEVGEEERANIYVSRRIQF